LCRCVWTGNSAGSLDPVKETAAAEQKVRFGFSTVEREAAELNGSSWRENVAQQSIEQTEFQEADLVYPPNRVGQGGGFAPSTPPSTAPPSSAPLPTPGPPSPPGAPSPKKGQPASRLVRHAVLAGGLSGRIER